jgi:hypothetical protein
VDKNMRTLKTLVIVMGLAVVIGATVLATLIMTRGSRLAGEPQAMPHAAMPLARPASAPLMLSLKLPLGARVLETQIVAGRLTLRAVLKSGGEAVFVFDAASGRLVARYDITMDARDAAAPSGVR